MRRASSEAQIERQIVTGMIISDRFLNEVQTIYDKELMEVPFARTVAGWCLSYWEQYEKAPGRHIQDIFNSHRRNSLPPDTADLIEEFLGSISNEYARAKTFNVPYLLDQAEVRFKARSMRIMTEDVTALLSEGDTTEAEAILAGYKRIQRPGSMGINPFTDKDAVFEALEDPEKNVLFRLPGELGKFVGPIERDMLIGLMAPEKRGKTWWLDEIAWRAYQAGCNVAVFDAGDMSKNQRVVRAHIRNARQNPRFAGEILIPIVDCLYNQDNTCERPERPVDFGIIDGEGKRAAFESAPNYLPCIHCRKKFPREFKGAVWFNKETVERLTWRHALTMGERTARRAKLGDYKLLNFPNGTLSVSDIHTQLNIWEDTEGFIPDVIVIDYADILAPEDARKEYRHQQNETWQTLRALSQIRRCAVITATQADATSYTAQTIAPKHFSESKGKYSHVLMMITLNQTPAEKREGVMRIGKMFVREDDFDLKKQVTVLQCPKLGRPYLDSFA